MKRYGKVLAGFLVAAMCMSMVGCKKNIPANKVFSVDDLPGKKIGVQLGTTGDLYATEDYGSDSVVPYSKGADAVMALKQGKVDCVIIDEQPAKVFAEKNKDLKILDTSYTDESYAICVAKENTELKENINKAIQELKDDGTLDKIVSNYIGDDTKGSYQYKSPEGTDRSNGKLVMATNAQFEPYEYVSGSKIVGIDPDLMQAIADKLGMELKIQDMEFDSIITSVESGKADVGAAGMSITEDRLKNIDFTDTYATSRQVIIVRKK